MAASHALPDLVARVRLDSTGVDAGIMSVVGSFGKASLAIAGVAAGLGLIVLGAKSMVGIAEEQQKSWNDLTQAVQSHNDQVGKVIPVTAEARAAVAKAQDDQHKAQDALTIAMNAGQLAQLSYNDAVTKYGIQSEQAYKAGLHLTDAHIRANQAAEAATDSATKLATAQEQVGQMSSNTTINLDAYKASIDGFIQKNKSYISNQAEVVDSYAALIRSGLSQKETQRVMNDAVDLAALKHISLTAAVDVLGAAEHGRLKGLIDLGITTTQFTDAEGNLVNKTKDVSAAMQEIDGKVKNGKDSLTDLQKKSNELNNDWQDLSKKGGPVILTLLDGIVTGATHVYDWFDRIGHDDKMWASISSHLVDAARGFKDWINNNDFSK